MQDHSANVQENGMDSVSNPNRPRIRKKIAFKDDHDNLEATLIEKNSKESSETLFANIVGYDDIKKIFTMHLIRRYQSIYCWSVHLALLKPYS